MKLYAKALCVGLVGGFVGLGAAQLTAQTSHGG